MKYFTHYSSATPPNLHDKVFSLQIRIGFVLLITAFTVLWLPFMVHADSPSFQVIKVLTTDAAGKSVPAGDLRLGDKIRIVVRVSVNSNGPPRIVSVTTDNAPKLKVHVNNVEEQLTLVYPSTSSTPKTENLVDYPELPSADKDSDTNTGDVVFGKTIQASDTITSFDITRDLNGVGLDKLTGHLRIRDQGPSIAFNLNVTFAAGVVDALAAITADGSRVRLRDAPGTPGTLNVQRDEDTAILTWSPPSNAETPIRYEYSSDGGSTWQSTGSSDTTYTVTGLEPEETYTFLVRAFYVDGTTSRVISLRSPSSNSAVLRYRRIIIPECPVGWQRTDGFARPNPRVLIHEVNLEMDLHNRVSIYKPNYVAIYVHPDEALETLDGWKLKVAVPYNHHREYLLTAENAVVVESTIEGVEGGFAFIENPEETPFPMIGMGFTAATVPGFDYRLYDDTGRKIDFGIACYKQGGIFQALKEMEDPRVLRNVLLESLDWDAATYIRSEWTVPVPVPAAPSLVKKTVVGTWANLKKQ